MNTFTQGFFVCDMCRHVDCISLAYPSHDFTKGPPAPWRCTTCQGKPWHDYFERHLLQDGETVVNRCNSGAFNISLG